MRATWQEHVIAESEEHRPLPKSCRPSKACTQRTQGARARISNGYRCRTQGFVRFRGAEETRPKSLRNMRETPQEWRQRGRPHPSGIPALRRPAK